MSHWAIRVIGSHEPGEDGHPGRSRSSIELVRRSPIRFIGIPKRCELGRNGTFWDTKGAGGRSKIDSHRFANMRTCALTHGLWTGCQCPVDQSGGERECISNAGYYSEQVNEPAVRVQHFCPIWGEKVSPNCYSSLHSLCEIPDLVESDDEDEATAVPEYENDLMVTGWSPVNSGMFSQKNSENQQGSSQEWRNHWRREKSMTLQGRMDY